MVHAFLMTRFPGAPLHLPAKRYMELVATVSREGIAGGAVYDALIAATAQYAGATLVTRDHRARLTYDRLRVPCEFIS